MGIISVITLSWGGYLWITRASWVSGAFANCAVMQICDAISQTLKSRDNGMFISLGIGAALLIVLWLMGGKGSKKGI